MPLLNHLEIDVPAPRAHFANQTSIGVAAEIPYVDLLAGDPGSNGFLRDRLGRSLVDAPDGNRPLIVVDHEDDRQAPDAGEVHRLIEITLRGRAVTADGDCGGLLATQLQRQSDAGRMRILVADRHADREIGPRPGKIRAALVTAPVEQQFGHRHTAPELCGVIAE